MKKILIEDLFLLFSLAYAINTEWNVYSSILVAIASVLVLFNTTKKIGKEVKKRWKIKK